MIPPYDGWGEYEVSFCPLRDCPYTRTWAKELDHQWLESQLMTHVETAHKPIEWVREVVHLQWEMLQIQKMLGAFTDLEAD